MRARNSFCALALCALLLGTAGCSLARPEKGAQDEGTDRFAGVYLVYEESGEDAFYENPNLEEYGADTVDLGELGTHSFPRQVLFAGEDGHFPGLEGRALYVLKTQEEWGPSTTAVGDLSGGAVHVTDTDEGTSIEAGGVLYFGPPENAPADWSTNDIPGVWRAYKVYQAPDGRAYLNGSGNAFHGGPIGITLSEEQTTTVDGEAKTDSFSIKIETEQVPRLEGITVRQYGADGALLGSDEIPPADEPEAAAWRGGAAWAVVEEHSAEGVKRALYDRPAPGEEAASHTFILLDARGVGREAVLTLK